MPRRAQGQGQRTPTSPFAIDRTAKLYIGGKQARPDGAYSRAINGANGAFLADVGEGNRKDIRNAVEAAHKAAGWAKATAHNRAQVLYYIAENLAVRADEFAARLAAQTGSNDAAQAKCRPRSSACSTTPPGPTSTTARCTSRRCTASPWRSTSRSA